MDERMKQELDHYLTTPPNEEEEEFCDYCGEPLEDGLCSASCSESAADEGREEGETDDNC